MSKNTERLRIVGWSIIAEWNNGEKKNIENIFVDDTTAQVVDDFLSDYENEVNSELNSKYKE
jgi:hypothetical protein